MNINNNNNITNNNTMNTNHSTHHNTSVSYVSESSLGLSVLSLYLIWTK